MLWEGKGASASGRGEVADESYRGNHGLGMNDLRNYEGMGAAHANWAGGLTVPASRKMVKLKVIATQSIRCGYC